MAGLKSLAPNEQVMSAATVGALVYGIFMVEAPPMADVKNSNTVASGAFQNVHKSVKTAVWTSTATVAGISLLARSPVIFVVGGLMTAALGWKYYHANAVNPHTGQIQIPSNSPQGTPVQPGSGGSGPA